MLQSEAAKPVQQGRSFLLWCIEVRTLAQRSPRSQDIKRADSDSVTKNIKMVMYWFNQSAKPMVNVTSINELRYHFENCAASVEQRQNG